MRFATRFIVLCWLIASPASIFAAPEAAACSACHGPLGPSGAHAGLSCAGCHGGGGGVGGPSGPRAVRGGCSVSGCHVEQAGILAGPMAARKAEKAFVGRTMASLDPGFFGKACAGCHVAACGDCHEGGAHETAKPGTGDCLRCHTGGFAGGEYLGLAPRESNARFGRGIARDGDHHLKMLPDVHAEAGMTCGDCHAMAALATGAKASKRCPDCHVPSPRVVEHAIPRHMTGLRCEACHSAWAPQAYGTFFLRADGNVDAMGAFDLRREKGGYLESVYLRRQDAPPLGVDAAGKVTPIVPRFILYASDIRPGVVGRVENRLMAAEWKALFPHTVRRGSVPCEGCHDAPGRWMREPGRDRFARPSEDGLQLDSFRDRAGQRVVNGAFLDDARVARLAAKDRRYKAALVEKWKRLIDRVDGSSGR